MFIHSQILTAGLNREESANVLLPFFHTAGWNVLMMPMLIDGGRVIITTEFRPGTVLRIIETERPTVCIGIEMMYKAIARHSNFAKTDFSCYRWMLNGAAPISRETLDIYWSKGVRMVNPYDMTEAGPNNLCPGVNDMTPEEISSKWISVGRPMYFNNVPIVDENGADVPDGERGELLLNGNLTFSGYWMDEERTRSTVRDEWVYTGDIGYKDKDGFYYICGRKKSMYVSCGENIYLIQIEHLLGGHPAEETACVMGVQDEKWGETGKALIVLKPGYTVTKEELQAYVGEHSASIKIPKYVQFIRELPKNAVVKVDVTAVRQM
ncbi:MAG: long-chain fatty acid--CoA ligase [Peptococcaceae bacterium]|nr:long-chain fatty acid--CoA ligase [Peptococcaceae bacterium]